jgi:16S rRNA processing protein RimM
MIRENCSLIGTITKPHGIGGQLIIRLDGDFADDIEPGEPLFVKVDEQLVPFFIEEAEVFPDRAILKLEFVNNPDEARKLTGKEIYLENFRIGTQADLSGENAGIYIGFSFHDKTSGIEGIIKDFIDNPLNPLFLVNNESSEFLIPVHPDFIVEIDQKRKLIILELPEGLDSI